MYLASDFISRLTLEPLFTADYSTHRSTSSTLKPRQGDVATLRTKEYSFQAKITESTDLGYAGEIFAATSRHTHEPTEHLGIGSVVFTDLQIIAIASAANNDQPQA